jgi:drug/metabolite transporter (DMT)-like permease
MSAPALPELTPRTLALGIFAGSFALCTTVAMLIAGRIGATGDTLTIWDLAGLRQGVAALLALPLLVWAKPWRHLRPRQYVVNALFGGAPFVLLLFGGMVYAPASHAGVFMNGTLPVAATLVAWLWLRDRPRAGQALGIAVIVAGMALVGREALASGVPGQWRGHLLFAAAACWFAIWYVAMRAWRQRVLESLAAMLTLNALVYVPVWLLFLPSGLATAPAGDIWLQIVVHGVFGAFVAIFGHAYAARTIGPMRQAAIMSGAPVLALVVAVPTLGEVPTPWGVAGAVTVTVGILLAVGLRLRRPR